ncbi:peptidase MA family metallohydrolase [bacterium]
MRGILFGYFLLLTPLYANLSTVQYNHIRLTAHEKDWTFGKEVVETIQSSMLDIENKLGLFEMIAVHVMILPTEYDFQKWTGGQIPDWGIAAADAQNSIIFLKSSRFERPDINMKIIVIHELCHVILGHVAEHRPLPRWFDEGFALYNSGELRWESNILLARSLVSNQIIPLDAINDVLNFNMQKAALAYRESLAAIEYLIEQYGIEVLARLVLAITDGQSMEKAILSVTGVSIITFEKQWIEYLRQKYLWYAILDTRIILSLLFVGLFLLTWIRKKYQSRQQRVIWENEADHELFFKQENSTLD